MSTIITTTNGQGTGASTGNPQTIGSSSSINGSTKNLQGSSETTNLNDSGASNSIKLTNQSPQTVSVKSTSTKSAAPITQPVEHHTANPLAIVFVLVLIVVAVGIFIGINRSSKITTEI